MSERSERGRFVVVEETLRKNGKAQWKPVSGEFQLREAADIYLAAAKKYWSTRKFLVKTI